MPELDELFAVQRSIIAQHNTFPCLSTSFTKIDALAPDQSSDRRPVISYDHEPARQPQQ